MTGPRKTPITIKLIIGKSMRKSIQDNWDRPDFTAETKYDPKIIVTSRLPLVDLAHSEP